MAETLSVAKYFNDLFVAENGENMDEMRMHKMMYLAQRESLMYNNTSLFDSAFRGWKFGPVLTEVRSAYKLGTMFDYEGEYLSADDQKLVKSVFDRYKSFTSWKLSSLSHRELSWKNSRRGLAADENGDNTLKLSDMRVDAAKELLRRKEQ